MVSRDGTTTAKRHTLRIDGWHPTLLNRLLYKPWYAVSRRKRADTEVVCVEAIRQGVERATGRRAVTITLVYPKGKRHCDWDAPLKVMLDALVKAQLLVDDSPAWLSSVSVRYETGPKATIVELEDVA